MVLSPLPITIAHHQKKPCFSYFPQEVAVLWALFAWLLLGLGLFGGVFADIARRARLPHDSGAGRRRATAPVRHGDPTEDLWLAGVCAEQPWLRYCSPKFSRFTAIRSNGTEMPRHRLSAIMGSGMEKDAARHFRLRWQALADVERTLPAPTPEVRLRQLGGLLEIARRAGWPLERPEAEVEEVRRRWRTLRSRLHGGPHR
jgi:hypothetical protein